MDNKEKTNIFKKMSDNTKASIFRWWLMGAVYLFIGFGTNIGLSDKPQDMVFVLSLSTGIVTIILYNPIVYGMFELERRGKILNKKYYERSILEGVVQKLLEMLKCFFVVLFVYYSYVFINILYNTIFNKEQDRISILGEPILFASFFLLYYNLITFLYVKTLDFIDKIKEKRKKDN